MDPSFSLEFNPMMNVKSVKDYENEIEGLKRENFELKARLTHASSTGNVPKILYEQSEQFSRLEQARAELAKQNEDLHKNIAILTQEKAEMERRYNNDVVRNNERLALLEDENKRLHLRLERGNKDITEIQRLRELVKEAERLNVDYKEYIQNEERKTEQERYEHSQEVERLKRHIEDISKEKEFLVSEKGGEIFNLRKSLETEINRNKSIIHVISDLKKMLTSEQVEKERMAAEIEKLKRISEKAVELQECLKKQQTESEVYMMGMNKLRTIISERLCSIIRGIKALEERLDVIKKSTAISKENQSIITKMKIQSITPNSIINSFRIALTDAYKKIEILKREAKDAAFFRESAKQRNTEKTKQILEELMTQFAAAKGELLECRKYLVKKASETKELKNENALLKREISSLKLTTNKQLLYGNNPLKL